METPTKSQANINTNPFSRAFRGLELFFKHNQMWAIIFLIFSGLGTLAQWLPQDSPPPTSSSGGAVDASLPGLGAPEIAILTFLILSITFAALVVLVYLYGIMAYVTWKTSKGETAGFGEAFGAVTKRFWTIMVVQVFTGLKILGGFLLLIVPGIRAALRYEMVLLPVFDENLNARDAMKRIKNLTNKHLMEIFGVGTVGAIVPVLGSVLQLGGYAVMYPELKMLEKHVGPMPKVHWLNYLGLILVGGLLILGGLGVFLLLSLSN